MRRAVFIDRDGVLTRAIVRGGKPYAPEDLEEFEILPEAKAALEVLARAGFLLIVATNQPDVGRGKQSREVVEKMHEELRARLPVDDIYVCYDPDETKSACYKPKPGMLFQAASAYGIDLNASYMVGDRWRDIGCGKAAGCYTVFVDRGYAEDLTVLPDVTCSDMAEAAAIILVRESVGEAVST